MGDPPRVQGRSSRVARRRVVALGYHSARGERAIERANVTHARASTREEDEELISRETSLEFRRRPNREQVR